MTSTAAPLTLDLARAMGFVPDMARRGPGESALTLEFSRRVHLDLTCWNEAWSARVGDGTGNFVAVGTVSDLFELARRCGAAEKAAALRKELGLLD